VAWEANYLDNKRVKDIKKIYEQIGLNVKKYRTRCGYSQDNLAYESGVNRAYIGYIERGERNPSVAIIYKIATTLKVPLHEFFIFDTMSKEVG